MAWPRVTSARRIEYRERHGYRVVVHDRASQPRDLVRLRCAGAAAQRHLRGCWCIWFHPDRPERGQDAEANRAPKKAYIEQSKAKDAKAKDANARDAMSALADDYRQIPPDTARYRQILDAVAAVAAGQLVPAGLDDKLSN